jgi:hypothetical protein
MVVRFFRVANGSRQPDCTISRRGAVLHRVAGWYMRYQIGAQGCRERPPDRIARAAEERIRLGHFCWFHSSQMLFMQVWNIAFSLHVTTFCSTTTLRHSSMNPTPQPVQMVDLDVERLAGLGQTPSPNSQIYSSSSSPAPTTMTSAGQVALRIPSNHVPTSHEDQDSTTTDQRPIIVRSCKVLPETVTTCG